MLPPIVAPAAAVTVVATPAAKTRISFVGVTLRVDVCVAAADIEKLREITAVGESDACDNFEGAELCEAVDEDADVPEGAPVRDGAAEEVETAEGSGEFDDDGDAVDEFDELPDDELEDDTMEDLVALPEAVGESEAAERVEVVEPVAVLVAELDRERAEVTEEDDDTVPSSFEAVAQADVVAVMVGEGDEEDVVLVVRVWRCENDSELLAVNVESEEPVGIAVDENVSDAVALTVTVPRLVAVPVAQADVEPL